MGEKVCGEKKYLPIQTCEIKKGPVRGGSLTDPGQCIKFGGRTEKVLWLGALDNLW